MHNQRFNFLLLIGKISALLHYKEVFFMSNEKEIWMETTHGRKSKCKTEFKAVVNKVLVSTLILTTILGTTTPAFAASLPNSTPTNNAAVTQTYEYGVSVENAISSIKNTIAAINNLKAKGMVSDFILQDLATQLYNLDKAVMANGGKVTNDVKLVIQSAEDAIKGLSNADKVQVAIAVVKADFGIDSVTAQNKEAPINNLKGFRDVVKNDPNNAGWAYDAIMDMVEMGLFAGTESPDANGYGLFSPKSPMTRAQFVTVVTRYLYDAELKAMKNEYGEPSYWFEYNYDVAIENGILKESEFSVEAMSKPMTRQEMAMVLVRAAGEVGDHAEKLIPTQRIADYNDVGSYYKDYVRQCYSMGMICGTDSKGTFAPHDTLNRAQAATVLYRLVRADNRIEVDFSVPQAQVQQQATSTTINQGQATSRPAKAGDTIVKADGTKVVLQVGPNGVLGEGQGVAPDANLSVAKATSASSNFNKNDVFTYDRTKTGVLTDSLGKDLMNQKYMVNATTGEGHWGNEWNAIRKNYPAPQANGTYEGQVSSDPYSLYVWDGMVGWIFNGK